MLPKKHPEQNSQSRHWRGSEEKKRKGGKSKREQIYIYIYIYFSGYFLKIK